MQLLFYCINIFNDDDDDNDEILPHNLLPFLVSISCISLSIYIFSRLVFFGLHFFICWHFFRFNSIIIIRDRRSGKIFQKKKKIPEPERQKITKPNQTNQPYRYARIKVKVKSTQPTNQPFK